MRARQSLPMAVWPLTILAGLALGGVALLMGMDASQELRSHSYYNGWSLLHGLVDRDLMAAQVAGFRNPTVDAIYVFLAETLPAPLLAMILGMLHALNAALLFAICWRMLGVRNPNRRMLAAGALALAGIAGAGGLSILGTAAFADVLSLGILASILGVVANWEDLADGDPITAALMAALAGIPLGIAFGLRPGMVVYGIGLALTFPLTNMPLSRGLWLSLTFSCGAALGMVLGGGHWMIHLATSFGNPVFPYFNNLFHSPWAEAFPYHATAPQQGSLSEVLIQGFDSLMTDHRDFRIAAAVILVPFAAIVSALKRDRDPGVVTLPGPSGWVMGGALLSFAGWALLPGTDHHLVPLEMLAPLVIVAAVGALPLPRAARRGLATALVAIMVATALPAPGERIHWDGNARNAAVPPLEAGALVLLSGPEPVSILIPSFARDTRFVRLDPALTAFAKPVTNAIVAQTGPLYSLHVDTDLAVRLMDMHGVKLDGEPCRPVTAPIAPVPFALCRAIRPGAASEAVPAADSSAGSEGSPAPR